MTQTQINKTGKPGEKDESLDLESLTPPSAADALAKLEAALEAAEKEAQEEAERVRARQRREASCCFRY